MTKTDDESDIAVSDQAPVLTDLLGPTGLIPPERRRSVRQWFSDRWSDPGRRRVMIGWGVLIASLVVYFFVAGIPWSLDWVFIYILAGIIISSLGSGVKWKRLVIDWLPLFLV